MTLIDKAKLLNTIATEVHYDSEHSLEMYAKMLSLINDAPEVDAVPLEDYKSMERTVNKMTKAIAEAEPVRHGRWIYLYDGNYKCSECGSWWTCEETPIESGMLFCPNCGASMDEVKEDDYEEPEINPCRGCEDYDGKGGCLSHGGCGEVGEDETVHG